MEQYLSTEISEIIVNNTQITKHCLDINVVNLIVQYLQIIITPNLCNEFKGSYIGILYDPNNIEYPINCTCGTDINSFIQYIDHFSCRLKYLQRCDYCYHLTYNKSTHLKYCKYRPVICEYCECKYKNDLWELHFEECKGVIHCDVLNIYIPKFYKSLHYKCCSGCKKLKSRVCVIS
jgi:hypothetical protein